MRGPVSARTELEMQQAQPGVSERGFSLVEVMMAIVILSVGLLSLAQMMVLATHSNTLSGRMTSSSALAKEQLERLKATPFYVDPLTKTRNPALVDGGDLDATSPGYVQFYDGDGKAVAGVGLFEVRWQIRTINTNLPLEMVEIRVRCLPAAGMREQFAVIGEARFTTYRTANVG
jgi:prepilin-type N-terminal cleavage/methylation domain-containing protein